MKWFGEPWPSDWRENGRAPVCEDDDDQIDVPLHEPCIVCARSFVEGDQGVATPFVSSLRSDLGLRVVYYHIQCFLHEIVGDLVKLD